MLQALCACNISSLNEDCTSGMLPNNFQTSKTLFPIKSTFRVGVFPYPKVSLNHRFRIASGCGWGIVPVIKLEQYCPRTLRGMGN
jgi:hypothetical protein